MDPEQPKEGGAPKIKKHKELKLIGEGTYGCVFYPGINCKGTIDTPNYVTKLQKNANSIKNEWAISQRITKLAGYKQFFAPIIKQCRVHITKEREREEVQKCRVLKDHTPNDTYVSNKMRYVGDLTLGKYLKNRNTSINEYWRTHKHILKGLALLSANSIIHYDLKENNIMYDEKIDNPIIIDFGLSIALNKLNATTYRRAPFVFDSYDYWCIDITVCSYIFSVIEYGRARTQKITEPELHTIINTFIYGKKGDQKHGSFTVSAITSNIAQFEQRYWDYFRPYVGMTWWHLYEHLVQFSDTWDNYSVAMIYLFAIDHMHKVHPTKYDTMRRIYAGKYEQYMSVLGDIIYAMPDERASAKDTIPLIRP